MTRSQLHVMQLSIIRPIEFGTGALVTLLAIYFGVVSSRNSGISDDRII